ncbi:MAG: RimK family protein [Phycisphaerales bacterium]|nr:RimK family protein [Phycisphaerales bacterium]
MAVLIVVDNTRNWPLRVPGVTVVSARSYLTEAAYSELRGAKVFNLCRSYRYQTLGYYVSLLAEARGHRPLPSTTTIQDLKSPTMVRLAGDDLEDLIARSLDKRSSKKFTLSIYFGQTSAKRYERLAKSLFNVFPAPLLDARFEYDEESETWRLEDVSPGAAQEIPAADRAFAVTAAKEYFSGKTRIGGRRDAARYDLAILWNQQDPKTPSDERAVKRFIGAAKELSIRAEVIDRNDYGRLAEFDALFIRENTAVNHHTYRFAQRAAAEGLVVIDDPESILLCTNKVYLAELFDRCRIPHPKTLIVHRDNIGDVYDTIGLPCVLKKPDSAFSQGVIKVSSADRLEPEIHLFLERSDLVIAQEYVPSRFDWRVGVLDRKPLYVCKYHMADGHWQIVNNEKHGHARYGEVEPVPIEKAPRPVVQLAMKAANLIGDGLYGVDIKEVGSRRFVIEVNDNPNIDAGEEDKLMGDELYLRVMRVFLSRIEHRHESRPRGPAKPKEAEPEAAPRPAAKAGGRGGARPASRKAGAR